jgi:hypothetical protein
MSRGATARGRRPNTEAWLTVHGQTPESAEEAELERNIGRERLRDENEALRAELAEVEGWYRLLQKAHDELQGNERRASQRTTELQVVVNRLEDENQGLRSLLERLERPVQGTSSTEENASMFRFATWKDAARRHRWAAAAVVTIATLVARDSAVQGVLARASARASEALGARRNPAEEAAGSGFVRYAAMVNSRDQLERARQEYNDGEGRLKGDALLEAQDRLRAAKARFRQARLAFLPELARQCELAHVPVPQEATQALATLKAEADD